MGKLVNFMLPRNISPKSGERSPKTMFIKVLLPAPLLPNRPYISPLFKRTSIFLKTILPRKDLDILLAANMGLDLNFIILNFFILLIELLSFLLLCRQT